jgi:hypothetical protein
MENKSPCLADMTVLNRMNAGAKTVLFLKLKFVVSFHSELHITHYSNGQ